MAECDLFFVMNNCRTLQENNVIEWIVVFIKVVKIEQINCYILIMHLMFTRLKCNFLVNRDNMWDKPPGAASRYTNLEWQSYI